MNEIKPDSYSCYIIYTAIKLHFIKSSYDAVKYSYKSKFLLKRDEFELKNERFVYASVAKKFRSIGELKDFFVSNWVYRNDTDNLSWIGNFINDTKSEKSYKEFLRVSEGFTNIFFDDIMVLRDFMLTNEINSPDILIDGTETIDNGYPPLVELILYRKIHYETAIIMSRINKNLIKRLDIAVHNSIIIGEDHIWNKLKYKLEKYNRLMKPLISNTKAKQIITDIFSKEVKTL